MHHLVTEMCTRVHISVTTWCIVGYSTGASWDLFNKSIAILSLLGAFIHIGHYLSMMKYTPDLHAGLWSIFSRIWTIGYPISQIPLCIWQISHNAPFCNRNVHISVTKWCIVGYGTGALWDLYNRSILSLWYEHVLLPLNDIPIIAVSIFLLKLSTIS